MAVIKEYQLVSMNQHYKRFSLDYYLDCQQKVGFKNIELWLGASHFYVDSKGYDDVKPLKKKLKDRGLNVVSVTTPSIAYQYQYASQEKEILEQFEKAAEAGQVVTAQDIKRAFDEVRGKDTGRGYIYMLLERHGWRKVMPRSKHPKAANEEACEASKKLSKVCWMPAKSAPQKDEFG